MTAIMETASKINAKFQPGNQLSAGHGAPAGNTNAGRHYLRSRRKLTIGQLPKGCSWINTLTSQLRLELERLVESVHGSVSPTAAMFIQSACRHEQAALLAQRWLRLEAPNMSHGERLAYVQAVASESDKRDKCVERLKLERDPQSILATLYAPLTLPAVEGEADGR